MSSKVIFEKTYTRDVCLILEQPWIKAFQEYLPSVLGLKVEGDQVFYHISDQVLEIWENTNFTKLLKDKLLDKNISNPDFTISVTNEYVKNLEYFKINWLRGKTEDKKQLKEFIEKMFEQNKSFIVWYFSSIDDRTPENIKKFVGIVRKEDKFFDENDKFLRNSLKAIYPEFSGFETMITFEEIENPPKIEILKNRSFSSIINGGGIMGVNLEEYIKNHSDFKFVVDDYKDGSEIKGSIAYKGLVRGVAKIVKRKDQIKFVKEGDVIVAPMTTPDYVSAMKLASAFVTDEGGIMCHAAIIARELKKPCIIGTKIATKVLKDGDLVEVDADRGVVTIIKNK
jgi:phosphohistidine swiveling domain-containing protein